MVVRVPMAMAMAAAVLMLAVAAVVMVEVAAAATYTVGAPSGLWDMQTDYAEWVQSKSFHPGDNITFTYSPELHDVVEVTAAGYHACSSANNISAFRTGNDVVPLTAVGTRYFLCGLTGHCGNGMKIRVDVVVAASSAPGPAAAAAGPASSSAAATTTSAPPIGIVALAASLLLLLSSSSDGGPLGCAVAGDS